MTWTVLWVASAEAQLATLWLNSPQRESVRRAADFIDRKLRHDPENAGESRAEGRRILLAPPLGVTFRVSLADRVVRVLDVWQFATRE